MDEDQPMPPLSLRIVFYGGAGFVMTILYALSVGPACWLMMHGYIEEDFYSTLYFPVFTVAGSFQPLTDWLVFWIDWWVPVDFTLSVR
jgi:hypothetical protein